MSEKMELFAFNLPKEIKRSQIELLLKTTFTKSIEATYYIEKNQTFIIYTEFSVLTFINWHKDEVIKILTKLGVKDFTDSNLYQDYPIIIDTQNSMPFTIDNNTITFQEYNHLYLIITAHVISQSIALELYEAMLSDYYERSRTLINSADTYSIFKRRKLSRFAKQLVLVRHDLLIDLHLLDKPNILWDNENVEMLYNSLAYILELKDRFEVIEYKLNSIKDDIVMVMDLTNHNHSSFLEWIIIVLIGVEIVMGLIEFMY